jgi:hypothetical protein
MRHPRQNYVTEVRKDALERLAFGGRTDREASSDVARQDIWRNRQPANIPEVIRHPVYQLVGLAPELVEIHSREDAISHGFRAMASG